jgi:hypothetical protein
MLTLSRYVLLASEFVLDLGACAIFFVFLKVVFS